MALSAAKARVYESDINPRFNHLPVQASVTIYPGAALSMDANGDVGPLAASEDFVGFAEQEVVGTTAGAKFVKVRQVGAIKIPVTGVDDPNDAEVAVYATDDDTFTTTSSGGVQIGKVIRHVSSTTAIVKFESELERSV